MSKKYIIKAEYWGQGLDSYWDYEHHIVYDEETVSRFLLDMGLPSDSKDGDLVITVVPMDSPKVMVDRNS